MNIIEKITIKSLHKSAWRKLIYSHEDYEHIKLEKKLKEYRWIIKNNTGKVIYDSAKEGYDNLMSNYPVVVELLSKIVEAEGQEKSMKVKSHKTVIYTLESNLVNFFPTLSLENQCILT